MQRTRTRLGWLATVLVLVLAGCTGSSPDPSPTASPTSTDRPTTPSVSPSAPPPGRVAVVVSPEPSVVAAAVEVGSRSVGAGRLDGTDLRVVTADDRSFLVDLASFFAAEGYELVCVVGDGAEAAVREVAPDAPSTRFCASPARGTDMPPNVLPINLRVEELGYVAGVALAADGGLDGPAGLVTASTTWLTGRVRGGLDAGLAAGGLQDTPVRTAGPVDEDGVTDAVTRLLDAGVGGILSLTGDLDAAVRDVVAEAPVAPPAPPPPPPGSDLDTASPAPSPAPTPTERFAALVAGPEARPGDEDGAEPVEQLLVVLELHLERAVAVALDRHLGTWDTSPVSVGLAEGAIRVDVTGSPRAAGVGDAVEQAVAGLRSGDLQVDLG